MKTFYEFVLTYRGADNEKGIFAEVVFEDSTFPRATSEFDDVSNYVEMQGNTYMSTKVFDALWSEYASKYSL